MTRAFSHATASLAGVLTLAISLGTGQSTDAHHLHASNPIVMPSSHISTEHLQFYSDLAVRLMQEYLQIDTTNPPGNEVRATNFLKKVFDEEGIENEVFEYVPGRANIWARIAHTGSDAERPLILLNHLDVVTSDASQWKVSPFSGSIIDGSMYGRGAQDMKSEGLAQLVVMIMLRREPVVLKRDIIFLGVADEEAAGSGSDWMIDHKRALLGNAEYLINEGGSNLLEAGRARYVGVDVAEKTTFWLHIVAHGRSGHASRPIRDSAPNRLIRALNRILSYQTPFEVLPVAGEFFSAMAPYQDPTVAGDFRNLRTAIKTIRFQKLVEQDEFLNSMLRNTISLTMLGGSEQTNVIPPNAWANLDVRLLPGEDPKKFLDTIRKIVSDPSITVEPVEREFRVANSSPTDTTLFSAISNVAQFYFPSAPVTPRLPTGYTENQRYRPLGIIAYGFSPYLMTADEKATEHGNNERIRIEELRRGFRVLYDVVTQVAARDSEAAK